MSKVGDIVGALLGVRRAEGLNDAGNAALVEREKVLLAELIQAPARTLEEVPAKAAELARLLKVGDFLDDLTPELAASLARDLGRLANAPKQG